MDLKRYVPEGRVSSGLLVRWDGLLVWGVGARRHWREQDGVPVLPVVGIGGGQEPGESLTETVQREALEEANAPVRLTGARSTLWIYGDDGAGGQSVGRGSIAGWHADGPVAARDRSERRDLTAELDGEPAPGLIWQTRLPLRREAGLTTELDYINPVWRAEFLAEPSPGDETPALLFVSEAAFRSMLGRLTPLGELLDAGARWRGILPPDGLLLELHGSALYVARHWDQIEW